MELKSKKDKTKTLKSEEIESKEPISQDTKIPFDIFFDEKVNEGKLRFWQHREISVFFEHKGLKKIEDKDKYEEILKLY